MLVHKHPSTNEVAPRYERPSFSPECRGLPLARLRRRQGYRSETGSGEAKSEGSTLADLVCPQKPIVRV